MTLENKLATLRDSYLALKNAGVIKNWTEYATYIGASRTAVSLAKGGDVQYLTDSFISKINCAMKRFEESGASMPMDTTDSILVIPASARGGTLGDFADSVMEYECEKMISPIKGAEFAIQVTGDSMSPEYPNGSRIIIKRINEDAFVEWGKVYVLDTDNGAVIKQIRKTDNPDVVECVSLNSAYQPFTIKTSFIKGWYRVLMVCALK